MLSLADEVDLQRASKGEEVKVIVQIGRLEDVERMNLVENLDDTNRNFEEAASIELLGAVACVHAGVT